VYIVMYYLPEENFLSGFKYLPNSWTLVRGGWGSQSDRMFIASTKPNCTGNDRNRGQRD
jgi:hypothetical protein